MQGDAVAKPWLLCQLKEMSARSGYEHEMSTREHTHKYINIHTCVNTHTQTHSGGSNENGLHRFICLTV